MSDFVLENTDNAAAPRVFDHSSDRTEMAIAKFCRRAQEQEVPITEELQQLFAPDQGAPMQRDENFTYCPWHDAMD